MPHEGKRLGSILTLFLSFYFVQVFTILTHFSPFVQFLTNSKPFRKKLSPICIEACLVMSKQELKCWKKYHSFGSIQIKKRILKIMEAMEEVVVLYNRTMQSI